MNADIHAAVSRSHARQAKPQRAVPTARRLVRPTPTPRNIIRIARPVHRRDDRHPFVLPSAASSGFQPNAYVDYGRFLTPEGGILIVYKDIDTRLRHTLWRIFAWSTATGGEAWFLFHHAPLASDWANAAALCVLAVLNFFVVRKPVELYRRAEIRPDCLIIEGDIFWRRHMENGPPAFQPDDEGNYILCGIYGTRWVEFLTARRFDELDRMPEVFMAHLQDAIMQLWERAEEFS